MDLKICKTLTKSNPLFIKNSSEINAKSLFLYFMDECDGLSSCLDQCDEFYRQISKSAELQYTASDLFWGLTSSIVNAFLAFVKECPHISISFTK